jgi:predicted ATPase
MSGETAPKSRESARGEEAIVRLTVAGFKSLREEQSIELRPLTVLAGANSSGKSSIMQPFLLLKQTLEASYDPGPLLLNGPNVRFTKAEQLLSRIDNGRSVSAFQAGATINNRNSVSLRFQRQQEGAGFAIEEMRVVIERKELVYRTGMPLDDVRKLVAHSIDEGQVVRDRCFLTAVVPDLGFDSPPPLGWWCVYGYMAWLRRLIHLPALRGTPERTYPVTAVGETFPGRFDNYVASILAKWQIDGNKMGLEGVCEDLKQLGLAWTVLAKYVNDAEIEIRVNRLPTPSHSDMPDLVSIADVGFGVSQTLPVVVALHTAMKGQAVYIEQPEIHLHPRAQVALATVLADAAKRGVQVIIETHSQILLLALQTLVAKGELATDKIILHWFARNENDGTTTIHSADLDDAGAFGDWPEDFGKVELNLESSYIDAAEAHLSGGRNG